MADELSKEDQALLDQMRNEAPVEEEKPAEQPPPEPAEEPAEQQAEPEERPRDDKGRFVAQEGTEEPAEQPEPQKKAQRVPIAELLEERKARQKLQEELAAQREQRAKLEGMFQTLSQRMAPQEDKPKTVEEDPLAALKQTQAELAQMRGALTQQEQLRQFTQVVGASIESFKAQTPDYADAYQHIRKARMAELSAFGLTPEQAAQQLQMDEYQVAAAALQRGQNPGQVIYELAKQRGYARATGNDGGRPTSGATPDNRPRPSGNGAEAAAKLATIAKGQQAARSLGQNGGDAPAPLTGVDALAAMSEKEIADLTPEKFRQLMGA